MPRRYHREENRQSAAEFVSFLTILAISLLTAPSSPAHGAALKDCVAMVSGAPATVHEGRYNILCLAPAAGPLDLRCTIGGSTGASVLKIYPHAIEGASQTTVQVSEDGPLPPIVGSAGPGARVFFSYDGPFDPIRDGYRLICRW